MPSPCAVAVRISFRNFACKTLVKEKVSLQKDVADGEQRVLERRLNSIPPNDCQAKAADREEPQMVGDQEIAGCSPEPTTHT